MALQELAAIAFYIGLVVLACWLISKAPQRRDDDDDDDYYSNWGI